MTFLSPLWFLLFLLIPAVVVLHLFRRHRRTEVVPSLLIWARVSRRAPRTLDLRVLRDLNLLLQILAVIVAALLLANPVLPAVRTTAAREVVLVMDVSASMGLSQGRQRRIDAAKAEARSLLSGVVGGARVALIAAGARPVLLSGYTEDRDTLTALVEAIDAEPVSGAVKDALSMAFALTAEGGDVHLFTDGAFEADLDSAPQRLSVHRVGSAVANVGITTFSPRRSADGWEVLVAVVNSAEVEVSATVDLLADGDVAETRVVDLPADATRYEVFNIQVSQEMELSARLRGLTDGANALESDDNAYVVIDPKSSVRVLLVSQSDYFLGTLFSVFPEIELRRSNTFPTAGYHDLVVFDGIASSPLLTGNYLLFGVRPPDLPTEMLEPVEPLAPITWDVDHPVFRGVDLSSVEVVAARPLAAAGSVTVIARSRELPLAYTYERQGLRILGFTFSLDETDLPLHVAFPGIIRNGLAWLLPEGSIGQVRQVRAGEPYAISLPIGDAVVVARPDGRIDRATVTENPFEIEETRHLGVYEVRSQSVQKRFAASLLSIAESDVRPRAASAGSSTVTADGNGGAGRPAWRGALLLLLACVALDWYVWMRRS